MYDTLKFTDSCKLHSSISFPLYHKVMIPGLCFGFKNCMKLSIIQQRQAPVPSNILKAAFSKYVLTELRHFYLIALLCQPRIPRFLCQTHKKKFLNCLASFISKINPSLAPVAPSPSDNQTLLFKRGAVAQVVRAPV